MTNLKIDGKAVARKIIEGLKKLPKPQKKLAAVFVGQNPASESFLKQKKKVAEELGIEFSIDRFPEPINDKELIKNIKGIGDDDSVGGMIIQLPLPPVLDRDRVIEAINPEKDIDALLPQSKVLPLAVEVAKDILQEAEYDLKDKVVGVVGRGLLVGKPIAEWLSGQCKKVLVFHSKSDLAPLKECDLVISGVGKAGLIKPEMLKSGAGVIDFGFDRVDGKIRGDLDCGQLPEASCQKLNFYTPTPGGTGPILVAEIFKNFYKLSFF